jgi:hypothetical protein
MATSEHSVRLAGVDLAGRNHVCAFFNTIDEEHRVLGSFYKDGLDRGEKAAHIVDPENREEHLKRLADAGIPAQKIMDTGQLDVLPWTDICTGPPVRPGCKARYSRKTDAIGCSRRLPTY